MTVNFTAILESLNHFKAGLLVNSIIFYQATYYFEQPHDSYLIAESLSRNVTEPIQDVASLMLLDNTKLYFLLVYIVTIVLFVVFLERMNSKRKDKVPKTPDCDKEYFIEKMLFDTGNEKIEHQTRNSIDEKEIMSCEVKEEILKKLLLFEEGTKYTDRNFNLSALSVKLKTNTKYLSYIINKYKKKDFNSYINELRILYIIKKMENNPAYLNYKISYLADECGFSSHSKFTAVFKSVVGMSPSRFMDMLARRAKNTP